MTIAKFTFLLKSGHTGLGVEELQQWENGFYFPSFFTAWVGKSSIRFSPFTYTSTVGEI